ncbi:hypothetical protein [Caballeronia sp. LZ035]|uniref:hypothetical protein n=1 Tax=Caballeronia sp. LZ035 TaxID=3038568 RepID=UPI002864252A|nr:hypothetical protein [Caballeronia sp. LZ035]MDR5758877.1 hypothetical protein [Caballeronia sp. LZ035]
MTLVERQIAECWRLSDQCHERLLAAREDGMHLERTEREFQLLHARRAELEQRRTQLLNQCAALRARSEPG